jgi:hypothetical protein
MNKLRLILTLITIAIVAVPLLGVALAYQNNLLGLFIPPEVNQIADNLMNNGGPQMEPPTLVGPPQYDPASRTFTLSFQYKNTFPFDITVNSMSGDIECDAHGYPLGKATLSKPVSIDAGETATLTVKGTWTDAAVSHFKTSHAGEETADVSLVDLAVDVSGIQVQSNERIPIPDVPLP